MAFRLYLDDDFGSRRLLRAQIEKAPDIVRAEDVGMSGKSDAEHLAYATAEGRVMVSGNTKDFKQLHDLWMSEQHHHAGIVVIHQQRWSVGDPGAAGTLA